MPGAYAHITLVNEAKETSRLEANGILMPAIIALMKNFRFCELGAVSPDYPYLDIIHNDASRWADLMHYEKTGDMIKCGIDQVRILTGQRQAKALAWLMGYTAHVVADVTIHPIVELKVGKYSQNKKNHRICELNQDAYIFQRLGLNEVGVSEHLDSGLWGCCDHPGSGRLDQTIASVWLSMLKECHPKTYASYIPNPHDWHAGFKGVVDKVEEGNRLMPFARHVAVNCGMTYPDKNNIDSQYIEGLATPDGPMHYDTIFDAAIKNVLSMWAVVANGVFKVNNVYQETFGNWDLDTGRDLTGNYIFWKGNKP